MEVLPVIFCNSKSLQFCRNLDFTRLDKSFPIIFAGANFRKINQNQQNSRNLIPAKINFFTPFKPSAAFRIEISHLICRINKMIGFYTKYNTTLKWVKVYFRKTSNYRCQWFIQKQNTNFDAETKVPKSVPKTKTSTFDIPNCAHSLSQQLM